MNKTLEQEVSQLHAEICAGLADPTRILILYGLFDNPRNVTQLTEALELSQPVSTLFGNGERQSCSGSWRSTVPVVVAAVAPI